MAALDLARSAYDVLANIHPGAEVDAQHSWSGADAAAAKGQSENAQKRRKRKRLEVMPPCTFQDLDLFVDHVQQECKNAVCVRHGAWFAACTSQR